MRILKMMTIPVAMSTFAGIYSLALKVPGLVELTGLVFWGALPVVIVLKLSSRE